jgi:hypothetical protein
MGTSIKLFIGRISLIVTAAAAIAGAAASVSAISAAAGPGDTQRHVVADGECPLDMHWSVDLGRCIPTLPDDMHW